MNKQQALDFINEYFSQDNRSTAYPIYFSIRDVGFQHVGEYADADVYDLYHDHERLGRYETLEEAAKDLNDNHEYAVPPGCLDEEHDDFWDFDCLFEDFCKSKDIYIYPVKKVDEFKGMFLLRSEAQDHLKSNYYHYHKDAIVYCHHAWRADIQKDFLESIKKILEETVNDV